MTPSPWVVPKGVGVRSKFIQVFAGDQAAHVGAEIRQPQSSVANNLTFKGGVVLLDAGRLDVYRYGVRGNRIAKSLYRSTGDRTDPILRSGWPSLERSSRGNSLVEWIGSDGVTDSLRRGSRIEDAPAPAHHRFVPQLVGKTQARSKIIIVGMDKTPAQAGLRSSDISIADDPRVHIG